MMKKISIVTMVAVLLIVNFYVLITNINTDRTSRSACDGCANNT